MELPGDIGLGLVNVAKQVLEVRYERKAFSLILRWLTQTFKCHASAAFIYKRSEGRLYKACGVGEYDWGGGALLEFFYNRRPQLPSEVVMAPLRRGRQVIGVTALAGYDGFPRGVGKAATEALSFLGRMLGLKWEERVALAFFRSVEAMMRGRSAKDICYLVMHELRRFIDYDHGSSLIVRENSHTGRIVTRQVAWQSGKSDIVGKAIEIDWEDLGTGRIACFEDCRGQLFEDAREKSSPPVRSCLLAPLLRWIHGKPHAIGLFSIASKQANFFLDNDRKVLEKFIPVLTLCALKLKGEETHE